MPQISAIREAVSSLRGVSGTWFEWTVEGGVQIKTLVVEVSFDTDPSAEFFDSSAMDDIVSTATDVLYNKTTMVVSHLRIVPRGRGRA